MLFEEPWVLRTLLNLKTLKATMPAKNIINNGQRNISPV